MGRWVSSSVRGGTGGLLHAGILEAQKEEGRSEIYTERSGS